MLTYQEQLDQLILSALQEDIGDGDHSTLSCIDPSAKGKAILKVKQEGILAGMKVAARVFQLKDEAAIFKALKSEGDTMQVGDIAFEVESKAATILSCERVILNCMQRMSGIATLTNKYTRLLEGMHTKILDTRKTTPNFRLLEKEAVSIGGGINHRYALYDMIMLKDNHIDYCGGIEKAVELAWNYTQTKQLPLKIEVETRSLDDVKKLIAIGKGKVFRIMLDNFSIPDIQKAMQLIQGDFETEASGGIHEKNMLAYAETGVDYISVGALIHQATSLDLSLKAVIHSSH